MTNNKKGESDAGMVIGASSPRQVVYYSAIFILSRTVVSMQVHRLLSVAVVLEEVVCATSDNICSFPTLLLHHKGSGPAEGAPHHSSQK